jgi:hypothetical protein
MLGEGDRGVGRPQDVPLIVQPPHSPELNPAERIIEEVRRHVEGQVYATLPDKYAAVEAFLHDLDANPDSVCSLAGWRWIRDALDALPTAQANAA